MKYEDILGIVLAKSGGSGGGGGGGGDFTTCKMSIESGITLVMNIPFINTVENLLDTANQTFGNENEPTEYTLVLYKGTAIGNITSSGDDIVVEGDASIGDSEIEIWGDFTISLTQP